MRVVFANRPEGTPLDPIREEQSIIHDGDTSQGQPSRPPSQRQQNDNTRKDDHPGRKRLCCCQPGSGGRKLLRRVVGGAIRTLASAPIPSCHTEPTSSCRPDRRSKKPRDGKDVYHKYSYVPVHARASRPPSLAVASLRAVLDYPHAYPVTLSEEDGSSSMGSVSLSLSTSASDIGNIDTSDRTIVRRVCRCICSCSVGN